MYSLSTRDVGMIHIPSRVDWDGLRFHHIIQNGMQFKTYALFISGIFHLIFLDCGLRSITETRKWEPWIKTGLLFKIFFRVEGMHLLKLESVIKPALFIDIQLKF